MKPSVNVDYRLSDRDLDWASAKQVLVIFVALMAPFCDAVQVGYLVPNYGSLENKYHISDIYCSDHFSRPSQGTRGIRNSGVRQCLGFCSADS